MDTAVLVDKHIEDGRILLKELFNRKWKIAAAFWNQDKEAYEWKLFISLSILHQEGSRQIYLRLAKAIMEIKAKLSIDIDDIRLIESTNDIVHIIQREMAEDTKTDGFTKSIHLTGNPRISGRTIYYIIKNIKK